MRNLLFHLVLALLGLGTAYVVWTGKEAGDDKGGDEKVTLVDCDLDRVSDFRFVEGEVATDLTRKKDGGASYFQGWVHSSTGVATPMKDRYFNVSEAGEKQLKGLAPFRAERSLGTLNATQQKELGMDKPKNAFSMVCGGKTYKFDVGSTEFSSGDYYFRSKSDAAVYLVSKETVGPVAHAQAELSEREVSAADLTETEHLLVKTAAGAQKKLYQRNRQDKRSAEWVDADKPDQRNELYGNWFARLKQMRIETFLAPGQKPGDELPKDVPHGALEPVATFDYLDPSGNVLDSVTLSVINGDPAFYYAQSKNTHGWVKVLSSIAKQVASDLPSVVSGTESSSSQSE